MLYSRLDVVIDEHLGICYYGSEISTSEVLVMDLCPKVLNSMKGHDCLRYKRKLLFEFQVTTSSDESPGGFLFYYSKVIKITKASHRSLGRTTNEVPSKLCQIEMKYLFYT